jgi:adenine-specific DNA methylase
MESILDQIDFSKVSKRARKESRSRETHLPPVSTYRWWARRTCAVSDAIVEAAVQKEEIDALCDPFAGGGTFTLSALLKDVSAYGQDVNPWAASGLATMLDLPPSDVLEESAQKLKEAALSEIKKAYQTEFQNGDDAEIAHTLHVAVASCPGCHEKIRLFPYAVVSLLNRKDSGGEKGWLACSSGHLFRNSITEPSECKECGERVDPDAQYTKGRIAKCPSCGYEAKISALSENPGLEWEPVLVERAVRGRREIDRPTDQEREAGSDQKWDHNLDLGTIPQTTETRVLRRHGYEKWEDCYPNRQLHLLDALLECCDKIATSKEDRKALRIAIIGSAEMAGHLSRWDRWYLKSYEAMANHRYNFTTLSCEPNVWGASVGRGTVRRRLNQIQKASKWLEDNISSEITVEDVFGNEDEPKGLPDGLSARVVAGSSEEISLPDNEVPFIFTDPPYHDDVRYGDLSALFRAWTDTTIDLRNEAVARSDGDNGYSEKLTTIFQECKRVLEPGGHMVISFANRNPEAWTDLFQSFIDAGFRACGFGIVHSENETDHSKRGLNACTMDLVLDLVGSDEESELWDGSIEADTDQEKYLNFVGKSFLKYVQPTSADGWRKKFTKAVNSFCFINR